MNLLTTKSHSENNGIKMLLYGQTGTGKTRTAGQLFEAGYKPLFISAESGTKSIAQYDIPMVDVSVSDKGETLKMEKRFDRLGEIYQWVKDGKHDFRTIFVDSFTEINKTLIEALKAQPEYADPKNTLKLYGENMVRMVKLARAFRDLPYNVVLVCLASTDKDEVGKRFIQPDLVGKVSEHLPPLMDEVLYLHTVEKDGKTLTQIQTKSGNSVVAKDRSGQLLPIENYEMGEIFKKLGAVK